MSSFKHEASEPSKPHIYLAGPMRGVPEFGFPIFAHATQRLRTLGYEVFSPAEHDLSNGFDPTGMSGFEDLAGHGFDLRAALAADMDYIARKATAVAVLPAWKDSSGARAEVALAHALGLPVAPWQAFEAGGRIDDWIIAADTPPSGTLKHDNGGPLKAGTSKLDAVVADTLRFHTKAQFDAAVSSGEVRTTSSTGGQKGVKPECFSLLPVEALEHVARHYGIGAAKYDRNQWRKGYEWSKSYDAAMRHLTAFWRGEDIDAETGSRHLAAVAFHALTLLVFMDEQLDHDDRYRKETP